MPKRAKDVRDLRERSLPIFFALLTFDWAVIVAALFAAAHFKHVATYLLAWFIVGTRQHALAVLGHEGTHGLIHPNKTLGDWIARVFCFWPLIMPYEAYSRWHVRHHQYLGTEQDSELDVKHGSRFSLPTRLSKLVLTFVGDLIGLGLASFQRQLNAVRPVGLRGYLETYLGPLVMWGLAVTALISAGLWRIPLLWLVSLPTSFWAVFRVREFLEHTGTTGTYRYHLGLIGRFCFAPNYIWVHYEHHQWSFIPCYRLLAARKLDDSVPVLSIWELLAHLQQPDYARIKLEPLSTKAKDSLHPTALPAPLAQR